MSTSRRLLNLPIRSAFQSSAPAQFAARDRSGPMCLLLVSTLTAQSFASSSKSPLDRPGRSLTFFPNRLKPNFNRTIDIDLPISVAGAFAFFTTYSPLPDFSIKPTASPAPTRTPIYYIDVEPKLSLRGTDLPIDALSICSVLSKFMGKNPDDWDRHLHGLGQRGYNMIHFAPPMQRGISNSPYSIYDQLAFDHAAFPKGEADVAGLIKKMENDFGLLGQVDVVLNHTANNSKWLEAHPEAGYNIETAPWLESAEELDRRLLDFGAQLRSFGLPTSIMNLDDLSRIMTGVKDHVIATMKLWSVFRAATLSFTAHSSQGILCRGCQARCHCQRKRVA